MSMGIIIALIIFGVIVTVHEFGHFICAKLSNIKVSEFSVGMGPQILKKQKGETVYSLRLLPIGGFCAMDEDIESDDERAFRNAKLWKRMIVLVAGAFMNFVLGFIMVTVMVCMLGQITTTEISGFSGVRNEDGSPTYYAQSYHTGLRHGDVITSIDGTSIYSILDLNYIFATTTLDKHEVEVKRDGERVILPEVVFRDDAPESGGGTIDFGLVTKERNFLSVMNESRRIFMSMGHIVGMSLKQLVTGKLDKDEVSGPVGVVSAISESTEQSESTGDAVFNIVYMTALITINIGIFNLLPLPALDGGRLLFCLIELVRRKPVKPEHEGYVHLAGMILLFGVMIFATYNDIVRLITK